MSARPPASSGCRGLLGPACRERDLAYTLVVSRVVAQIEYGLLADRQDRSVAVRVFLSR